MDATSTDTSLRPRNPITRRMDPATSHAAARAIITSGRRDTQAQRVLEAVRRAPGSTSAEIGRIADLNHEHGVDRYIAARRLPEVELLALVRRGPARRCTVSDCMAITWYPVETQAELFNG